MSCEKCNQFQQGSNTYFYRWKNANIEIRGCMEHVEEIMNVLTTYSRETKQEITTGDFPTTYTS